MGTRGRSGTAKSGKSKPSTAAPSRARKQHDTKNTADLRKAYAEALEREKAVDDILRAIAGSPANLKNVLRTVAENAARLCGADDALIFQIEGDRLRLTAAHGPIPNSLSTETINRGWVSGRAILERRTIHIPDLAAESDEEYPISMKLQRRHGHRTMLATPMFMNDRPLGLILIRRQQVQPFSEAQIGLLNSFANQAAIAIENTRFLSELETRNQELDDALEQQRAMGELLKAISGAKGELEPVFETLLKNAIRLCDAQFGILFMHENGNYTARAIVGATPELRQFLASKVHKFGNGTATGRAVMQRKPVQIVDLKEETDSDDVETRKVTVEQGGGRTIFSVPMMQGRNAIGAITIYRREVRPFGDKQIELVSNFAQQAVIAVENAHLLNNLRDALRQQTATANVLKTISGSAFDLDAVFDTLLRSAMDLCDAFAGHFLINQNGEFVPAIQIGFTEEFDRYIRERPTKPGTGSVSARTALTGEIVHVRDVLEDYDYELLEGQRIAGFRAVLGAPLLQGSEVIGIMMIARDEPKAFSEADIRLVQTFCDQAVIALKNARLLNQLKDRNDEVSEALDQQLATADILRVISTSPTDTQPVFDAIARHAARLCKAEFCFVFRFDGDMLHFVAHSGVGQAAVDLVSNHFPRPPGRGSTAQRAVQSGKVEQIPDALKDAEYERKNVSEHVNYRSLIAVPMLRDGKPSGAITVARKETGYFPERQVELLQTFAEQAVIAVENVRLFTELESKNRELNETLDQRTATAEVLKTISRSAFDLETVLQTLVASAVRLCDADQGTIARKKDGMFYRTVNFGFTPEFEKLMKDQPVELDSGSATGRALLDGEIVHIPDVGLDPSYTFLEAKTVGGLKSIVAVPMLREGEAIGVFALTRTEVRPFTSEQIDLVSTFADQAAIAIENVRLFEQAESRSRELAQSLEDLQTAQDRLVQTEKLASLGQLTAGIAHEIKNPLNFVNNFSAVSVELLEELGEAIDSSGDNPEAAGDIGELRSMLKGNLEKILFHGQRADSIIKNMLMHARQGSGEYRDIDVNALVEESLNLAYHGARAENRNFNITLEKSFDPSAGKVNLNAQEITRVLLNLLTNGFYAARKRGEATTEPGYEPTLGVSTENTGNSVRICIRDNGTGMPATVRGQIFTPFFTTKPVGEGTGLGLSICHDIVVKQHGGMIEVDSQEGEFTEFVITLPRKPSGNPVRAQQ